MDKKYNSWSNYATWRVQLEIIDGISFVKEDITSSDNALTIDDVADFLENNVVESALTNYGDLDECVALSFARSFIGDVNWKELAEHAVENYPELLK